ncbi:MAG: beta-1,3-glucanase family protein [Gammaproteobacteria bacterium]
MFKPIKSILAVPAVSVCALLLAGCPFDGGGSSTSTPVVTADAIFPSSVESNSTFTITVLLTSSPTSTSSLPVQIVDVGAVTPLIDCGAAKNVTVGGGGVVFSCQAPQAILDASNTHQLQINVSGKANLSTPASVDVVNGGSVNDKLTDGSGGTITTAMPGQAINVAFSTSSTPPGAGKYTVTAPSGWTVANGGVCTVQGADCNVAVTVSASAPDGDATLNIASAEGSSELENSSLSLTIQQTAVKAHATIPSSVESNSTFSITVSLTSTPPATSARPVQIVDVGAVTPLIDCGAAQNVTIGGAGVAFSCQAPQTVLGQSNIHQLQINVSGKPNLGTPVSVDVINGGLVNDKLTNSSGGTITTATPGQTINVAFSTNSTPPGVGKYTVAAPSGWTVANGGVCSVQGADCNVAVTVSPSAPNGMATLNIASEDGSSKLESDSLSLTIQAQTPTDDMTFQYAQNISNTLYANLPSPSVTFTYQPQFVFKNTSAGTLSITAADVSGLTGVTYTCDAAAPASSPTCSLPVGKTYTVDGDLNSTFNSLPTSPTAISIAIKGGGTTFVQKDASVSFVKYVADHVAVRVVNSDGNTLHVAAAYTPPAGQTMVTFDATTGIGTLATAAGAKFQTDQLALPADGGVIYLPYGNSGVVVVTRANGGFNSEPAPDILNGAPPFLQIEPTYIKRLTGPTGVSPSCPASATICESLTGDQTYVQFISTLGTISTMGNAGNNDSLGQPLNTQAASFGVISNESQQQIFSGVQTYFDNRGAPWKYVAANDKKNYIQKDGSNITVVLAPIQVVGNATYDPMADDYYDTYVNELWTYLQNTPIYVDAAVSGATNCVLKGQVVPASSTSPNAGKLVFGYLSGTCPPEADSVLGTMTGNECGYKSDGSGGYVHDTRLCADTPDLVFAKFNKCDFLNAAGSLDCHPVLDPITGVVGAINRATFFDNEGLWGPNVTYRSVVGRAIAAYQAVGFLPPCGGTTAPNPASVMISTIAARYVEAAAAPGGGGLTNPSCLLPALTSPTYNVYTGSLLPYVNVYTYSYGDFLGRDGTITYTYANMPPALADAIPRAQPVTVTLH